MSKRRFLIKGGKGKIGVGERQVRLEEIIPIYEDNSLLFAEMNIRLRGMEFLGSSNRSIINYNNVPLIQMKNDDFSNSVLFFNPNPYAIVKNTKNEFFFGIDKSKPNTRFNPQGTVIKLDANLYDNPYNPVPVSFYCLANEKITFQDNKRIFYKLNPSSTAVASFNFRNGSFYGFSIVREDINLKDDTVTSEFKTVKVSLTSAQLIKGEAVSLIPAQGKDTVIELVSTVYRFNIGSSVFNNEAGLKLQLGTEDMFRGSGVVYISSTTSFIEKFIYPGSKLQQKLLENAPLTVVPFSTPPTSGNGSVDFYLTYRVINL
ncbi:hypothetical protein [Tenacibaculum ovolyticum]|uniref:hypothetical protein n=1 Tax=Tenacibaculum ovolyticum TaxID=104270 RepID=UPI000421F90F|nr:hypothetical protein [Tenacibaculum ovolyticum]